MCTVLAEDECLVRGLNSKLFVVQTEMPNLKLDWAKAKA